MSIANELVTRGHNQNGLYEAGDGSVCLSAAAAYAHGLLPTQLPVNIYCALMDAINGPGWELAHGPTLSVVEYSDSCSTDAVLRVAKLADEILSA